MAGRRAALKAIDWVAFAERVPPNQRTMFNNLKTRSDAISAKFVFPSLCEVCYPPSDSVATLAHFTSHLDYIAAVGAFRRYILVTLPLMFKYTLNFSLALYLPVAGALGVP